MTQDFTSVHPMLPLGMVTAGLGIEGDNIISQFITEYSHILIDLRWMIVLGIVLIISDFWFGISESKKRKKKIRRSSAFRRTLNKTIDYFCYVTLGSLLGKALGEYFGFDTIAISVSVIILCYAFEIDSIYGHICAIHGIKKHYSIWKLIGMVFTLRFKSFGDAIKNMNEQSTKSKTKTQE